MKQACIDKICNLPTVLNKGGKSLGTLLTESQFKVFHKEINIADIIQYLENHTDLLDIWKQYSDDKRTIGGFYYRANFVGSISHNTFENIFTSDIEACADYILKEVSFWLHINYE